MDVFLLPSLFEGLPVVLVEAQAAGLPCFVADTVDPGAAFAGNIHYLPLQNEAAWADSIAAADLTRDPNAQAKAIACLLYTSQSSATGANSLRRLVYCRPLAGQNRIPRSCKARISSKISPSMSFFPYCSRVPSRSLQTIFIIFVSP